MAKTLPIKDTLKHTIEHDIRQWAVSVPVGFTVEDLLTPECWRHHAKTLRTRDIVFADAIDGSFDIGLRVVGTAQDGVVMRLWPHVGGAEESVSEDDFAEPRMVGDRMVPCVEFTPRTKWRGLGLDGNEIFRGKESKEAALVELQKYAALHKTKIAA